MAESEEIPFDFDALERLSVRAARYGSYRGQSLAFWVAHYGLPVPAFLSFISSDAVRKRRITAKRNRKGAAQ